MPGGTAPTTLRGGLMTSPIPDARPEGAPARLPSRRQFLALAAVLAATVLTAGAAIAGLTRPPGAPPASTPTVDQVITPAATTPTLRPPRVEPGD